MSTDKSFPLTERRAVILVCGAVYLAVALWFWHEHLMPGDASSRLANAYYTLYSRDPHLAAIGFVWNPLPSLLLLPFLPLKLLIPGLTQQSGLAVLVSALLMTGVVALVHDVLAGMGGSVSALGPRVASAPTSTPAPGHDRGLRLASAPTSASAPGHDRGLRLASAPTSAPVPGLGRGLRLALTAAFALHPMTVLYAGNGMSEACFLLCLMLAVRALQRWLAGGRAESLVPLGLALALAYGARYEAIAPVAAVPVLVALVTWRRTRSWALARTDAVLAGLPGLLAVLLWALAGRIIVGEWFATFTSQYGNSAQVTTSAADISSATGGDLAGRTAYLWHQSFGLAPFAVLVLALAVAVAWRRRDPGVLAPVIVLGSVLAFDAFAFLTGTSFGWLRFQIAVVPLTVLLAGYVLAGLRPFEGAAGRTAATSGARLPAGAPEQGAVTAGARLPADASGRAAVTERLRLPADTPGQAAVTERLRLPAGAPEQAAVTERLQPPAGAPGQAAVTAGWRLPAGAPWRMAVTGTLLLVFAAFPAMVSVLRDSNLSREEAQWVTASGRAHTRDLARVNAEVAADLDAMHLPDGSVITDVAYAFGVVLASADPHQFVITPDRDFQAALTDPAGHHVRYLLLSANGPADAVRIARYGQSLSAIPAKGTHVWHDEAGDAQWTLVPVKP